MCVRQINTFFGRHLPVFFSKFSRYLTAIQTATRWTMAIENKPEEEFDTVFSLNDSLEPSSHSEHDCGKARIFKIIVIGDSNVGKTCLTYRFCGGTFLKNPEATIGVDFRERAVELDGETIKVRGCTWTIICRKDKHASSWCCFVERNGFLIMTWNYCGCIEK